MEAASRGECFAQMKMRGIAPMSVKEGGGRAGARPSHAGHLFCPSTLNSQPATRNGLKAVPYVLAVACVLLVIAGGLWWWMQRDGDIAPKRPEPPPKARPEKKVQMPTAAPILPTKEAPRKVVPKGTPMAERKPPKTYRDENGILRYEGGMRARDPERPHHIAKRLAHDPLNDPVFRTRPENEIAMLLTATPGDTVLSLRRYDDAFEAEFLKSLEYDIEVTEDDTPARAELKRAMSETKRELAERMKKGEKLGDILEETRSELRRLSEYRRNMEKMVAEAAQNPDNTERDVADFIEAANKMLTDNGMKPIRSGIVRKNLMMRARKQKKTGDAQ